ncbi:type 1 glutamine amidotransferase domain-containing protein [Spongiactinospora sp. TRM90649]|uniref:type 1 glutamine amidotransferase domain-containing protein n=1 Tax=Spongiactinospora sp. TRM90649 TaxID=3031114 RepID=UPI0023F9A4BB|nr:type 1 glutamine amidotransferase domain-containing protein [Spongiactinospora sp. TRM90649]MDF5752064.1 type 1 glutamine amidotransferase domain-containing protein [Spongiactinospora sp. TRM90649]
MADVLILMTKAKTLGLLDGRQHASGFWAEEFVVPYERLVQEGYDVDIATIGGEAPTPDQGSLTPFVVGLTRPKGSPDHDEANVAHYNDVIGSLAALREPMNVADITKEKLAGYAGVYISGGHGAMEDLPHDAAMTGVVRWILELGKPLAVVCHGQSALLPLRNSEGRWPLEGVRMTAFSHDEEMVTEMAGQLPFVLQIELERLGARYEKSDVIWGSHVVEDGNIITGQNPYSSTALAEAFVKRLAG